ncbi:glucosamine 6-phosphate N-acetyltransferase isoform X1 [Cimex lectularius]|uniref:Glucosamine 6-phosphate N-acetyltransferase n=1 Tax=Cimex lectularius TaxID=79782 RepID=A0A8I6TFT2_CIMLE|nr:glucosamine 6-phosphate N-acetyltransferase isoform X1 [Cimex lectularius]XP_024082115.1 glucosamine 6-phosphate N-acetyltransferase isoform X1 [Cimex lectularius]
MNLVINSAENASDLKPANGISNGTRSNKSEGIYSSEIYGKLNLHEVSTKFKSPIDVLRPAHNLKVRPLEIGDFERGYLDLLGQLTDVGHVPADTFDDTFRLMKERASHYITVIEDAQEGSVIASGTLFLEQKFIHSCRVRARIEDVVVSENYRGKQLGKIIVLLLIEMAKHLNCYKVSLECKDENFAPEIEIEAPKICCCSRAYLLLAPYMEPRNDIP